MTNLSCFPALPCRRGASLLFAAALALFCAQVPALSAFTVVKDVNANPPKETVVIFDKDNPADQVELIDNESCKMTRLPDGSLESRIIGNGEVKCAVKWKPGGPLGPTFNMNDYGYVVVTLRLEGHVKETAFNGKIVEKRPDNLWFPIALFNEAGERMASANFTDATPDGRTPDTTTKIAIPIVLLNFWAHDTTKIASIGFTWDKTRPTSERDFRLVIDRIALAE